jgi:ribonuclease HII
MPGKVPRKDRTAGLDYERDAYRRGFRCVFGIDEAGRGPWAGPVMAGAVCLAHTQFDELPEMLKGVRDSKDMTRLQREAVVQQIQAAAVCWGVGEASAREIDTHGIVPATRLAMQRALDEALVRADNPPDCILTDSMPWPEATAKYEICPIVRGDRFSLSIAAASVLAKVYRDAHMIELDRQYPAYGFARHKGYGTAAHREALEKHGPSPVHRTCFRPIHRLIHGDDAR